VTSRLQPGKSCSTIFNNRNKKFGTRRSKLEKWLEIKLKIEYPNLDIRFNEKEHIKSELDIYFIDLKLGVELNGIFHYEPIYGVKKLEQVKNNDNRKFQACLENGIELIIINVTEKYFKEDKYIKYLNIIKEIVSEKIRL
jgi:very-short-patch-repair endonuclease